MARGSRKAVKGRRIGGTGKLIGARVLNLDLEEIGRIEAIMVDASLGQATYAIVTLDALSGTGERLFPIPWKMLRLEPEGRRCILCLHRERLKTAPGFSRHDWPRMADREWALAVHGFYGEPPYWEELPFDRRGPAPGRRVTDRQQHGDVKR